MSRRSGGERSILIISVGLIAASCGEGPPAPSSGADVSSSDVVLGSTDDRVDAYKLTDPNLSPFIGSTASMWLANQISDQGNGTTTISNYYYTSALGQPLCAGTKFYNQPVGAGLACTAFFIAPDMVATADHCLTHWGWSWSDWRLIVDFANASGPNSWSNIVPNKKIYRPTAVVAENANDDWAVMQVTPPLENWRPTYPLSAAGAPTTYQFSTISSSVAALGYGNGLPLKYSANASAWTFGDTYFLSDLDIFQGNSGSPVFDTATSMTLGIVTADYDDDYVYDSTNHCNREASYPNDRSPQNSIISPYVQPIANLVAPAGNPIEPSWRTAKHLADGPAAVVLSSGDEYVFGIDASVVSYKHRDTATSWSAWAPVPGAYTLSSQPVAVEGYNDIWLFGEYQGQLMYNHRYTNNTWSNWVPMSTPAPLARPPAAFTFDTPGANGLTTREIVLAIVGTDGVGRMIDIPVQIQGGTATLPAYMPGSIQNGKQVVPWTSGGFALISGTPGAVTGFGTTDVASGLMTVPTVVNGSNVLACVRAVVNGPTYPYSPATISWSACPQSFPSNLPVQSAQGVGVSGGTQYLVARGVDDTNLMAIRSGSGAAWSSWSAFGGRSFAKPVITKSMGSWWTYTLAADRRVAVK
jgi:V8-like Glu-specific endopeptidase